MTRPDVKQKRLGDFLDWILSTVSQCSDLSVSGHQGTVALDGALQSLVNICMKNGAHYHSKEDSVHMGETGRGAQTFVMLCI